MPRKHYLQDLRPNEIPHGTFHVARWHESGKVWISRLEFSTRKTDVDHWVKLHNDVAVIHGSHLPDYFVWHDGLTASDLDQYRSSKPR